MHVNLSSKNMATKAKSKTAKKTQPKKKSAKKPAKWVYTFGDGKAEGRAGMRNLRHLPK